MTVNFCPNRMQMIKEVEACLAAGKLEALYTLCTCCVYAVFQKSVLVPQCLQCSVQKAIRDLASRQAPADLLELEYLGYC